MTVKVVVMVTGYDDGVGGEKNDGVLLVNYIVRMFGVVVFVKVMVVDDGGGGGIGSGGS